MTPTRSTPIQTQFATIDGLSIRFAESEHRDDHALLLSPWLESLFAFEPTWPRLTEDTHLVAIDLPGFGHSERREELLSPRTMAEFVIRVADGFGLDNPHVIGPDVGTGPPYSRPRRIRAGSAALSSAAGARRSRLSSAAP